MNSNINEKVKKFYNNHPFPDFDLNRFLSRQELKTNALSLAKYLDENIPPNASVIDIGTGTGQLAALLSIKRNCVYGIDFSDESLKKAQQLKNQLKLNSLVLKNINILNNEDIKKINLKFDYILCFGVLHHTENPFQAFKNILTLLNPGGFIAIGLYHKLGRLPLKIKSFLIKNFLYKSRSLKNYLIKKQAAYSSDKIRTESWWQDQYLHPHETTHTLKEVLGWFKQNNITFMQSIPLWNELKIIPEKNIFAPGSESQIPTPRVGLWKELPWAIQTCKDGGYFISFGQKTK